jgi:hypothetical protein
MYSHSGPIKEIEARLDFSLNFDFGFRNLMVILLPINFNAYDSTL